VSRASFCALFPWASGHKTTLIPGDVCMVDIRLETRQKTPTHAHILAAFYWPRRRFLGGAGSGRLAIARAGGGVNEFDSHASMHERSPRWIFSGRSGGSATLHVKFASADRGGVSTPFFIQNTNNTDVILLNKLSTWALYTAIIFVLERLLS
jgi:hypothetical protein